MQKTPKSFRLHIGIFGRRNAGKSSLLNALTRQQVSIVSEVAGTTTDPVEKPMEILPLGPVLFIDTAGIDDVGALGQLRVEKTRTIFDRTDIGIIVAEAGHWNQFEQSILDELRRREIPAIVAFNKCDLGEPAAETVDRLKTEAIPLVPMIASTGDGVLALREALIRSVPEDFLKPPPILNDLVPPDELALLVIPVDLEAPKGRLILPQVQTIRDLLDGDAQALIVKETGLRGALARLNRPPAIVVTDSQAFEQVAAETPPEIPMTGFSILFARQKGDLYQMAEGALAIGDLKPGDRVLIAEACTHHPIADDIGRVKIPRWLQDSVGGPLKIDFTAGRDFPDDDLEKYDLIVHCGACMWTRREMLSRLMRCRQAGVPVTNYGITIAYTLGVLERALKPFPELKEIVERAK